MTARFDGILDDPAAALAKVQALPGVASASVQALMFVTPDPDNLFPDYTLYSYAPVPTPGAASANAPIIVAGRAADPHRPDEIVVNQRFASATHARVGQKLTLHTLTDDVIARLYRGERPENTGGPDVVVKVVGIGRSPADF
ncbi:MAG: hypothetical protein QOG64_2331, partial [Acidimicrobiaceae bacterium]|nr:hypothetical protein [Acidimicrobiaceae bacterium]